MLMPFKKATAVFRREGGTLRMSEALRAGISRHTLYAMRDAGVVEQLSRGLYRLASLPALGDPDVVTVARRIPQGVVCLISALYIHELGTEIPRQVDVAVLQGSERPRVDHPPVRVHWFSGKAFTEGIDSVVRDGVPIRVYNPEKTLADLFKYRNKLGLDVALEALKDWNEQRGRNLEHLRHYARICRVESVIRPYLEALN